MRDYQISDLLLEKYLLRELPEKRLEEITLSIRNNSALAERVKKMEESGTDILREYPPEMFSSRINIAHERAELKKRKARSLTIKRVKIFAPLAAAGIAAVSLLLYSPLFKTMDLFEIGRTEITRIKGDGKKLYIYIKSGDRVELLKDGDRVKEKDIIQIAYRIDAEAHGLIFSLDGTGNVTLQFPKHAGSPTRMIANKTVYLPDAYELDNAPEFERFFLIISKDEIDVGKLLTTVKKQIKDFPIYSEVKIDFGSLFEIISFNVKKGK